MRDALFFHLRRRRRALKIRIHCHCSLQSEHLLRVIGTEFDSHRLGMPRPKGSKKEKTRSRKLSLLSASSSPTAISSPSSSTLTSAHLPCPNELLLDEMNWLKVPFQGSPTSKINRSKKTEANEEALSPTTASNEFSARRVVVNPAVLRYLEQNRQMTTNESIDMKTRREAEDDLFHELTAMDAQEESQHELSTVSKTFPIPVPISASEWIDSDRSLFQDDLFRDFSTCSTDFLPSARLAEWILSHPQSIWSKFLSFRNSELLSIRWSRTSIERVPRLPLVAGEVWSMDRRSLDFQRQKQQSREEFRMAAQIARRLIVLGAPGSGKGTIASRIVKTYGMPYIVVGDILRQHIQRRSGEAFSSLATILSFDE